MTRATVRTLNSMCEFVERIFLEQQMEYYFNEFPTFLLPCTAPCSDLDVLDADTRLRMTKGLTRGHLWKSSHENVRMRNNGEAKVLTLQQVLQVVDHEREAEFEGDPKLLDAHNLSVERSPVGVELFQIVAGLCLQFAVAESGSDSDGAGNSNYPLAEKIASQLGSSRRPREHER
eukprot:765800-Hanusia_phi.AAC.3